MENIVKLFEYKFTPDQLQALDALLKLVHYDSLAYDYYVMLPQELKKDLDFMVWMGEI